MFAATKIKKIKKQLSNILLMSLLICVGNGRGGGGGGGGRE